MGYQKSESEVRAALQAQIKALQASCRAFDAGEEWEAARIASALYILLYDSGKSISILSQLGIKNSLELACSGEEIMEDNLMDSHPLVAIRMGPEGVKYVPKFDGAVQPIRYFKFRKWRTQPVFVSPQEKIRISRDDLILNMRNQDGGGHYDKTLKDDRYAMMSRSAIWRVKSGPGDEEDLMGLELVTMRQIGWEIGHSLEKAGLV